MLTTRGNSFSELAAEGATPSGGPFSLVRPAWAITRR
jgi:hypothetical protein